MTQRPDLVLGSLVFTEVEQLPAEYDPSGSGHGVCQVLTARIDIADVPFYAVFVRIEDGPYFDADAPEVLLCNQRPVDDPSGMFRTFLSADPDAGAFQTIQVPGFEGDWVLMITPYGV